MTIIRKHLEVYGNTVEMNNINNGVITDIPDYPGNTSFKCKQKMIGQTESDRAKDVQIMVLLKDLSNFCRTLEMLLISI